MGEIDRKQFLSPQEVDRINADMIEEKGYDAQIRSLENWDLRIEATKGMSPEVAIPELAKIVIKTSKYHIFQVQERFEVHEKSRDRLLSIPGHAEYFGKRITDSYGRFRNGYAEGKGAFYIGHYRNVNREAFATLAMLPSTETVRVLGPMLKEDWKWPDYEEMEKRDGYQSTLAIRALSTLAKLPIANPPSEPMPHILLLRDNLETWQQWYAEIEAGRRTFRFIGDNTEYDLRGPVRRGGLDDRSRGMKRPVEAQHEELPGKTEPSGRKLLPYILGVIFLLAGVFIYLRERQNAAHRP